MILLSEITLESARNAEPGRTDGTARTLVSRTEQYLRKSVGGSVEQHIVRQKLWIVFEETLPVCAKAEAVTRWSGCELG